MIFFYRVLFLPLWLLMTPYYAFKRIKRGGYSYRWWQRWGVYETRLPKKSSTKKRIWIHAVSVGELKSIGHLLHKLSQDPQIEVFLTISTSTAYRVVEERYVPLLLAYAWFPWDFYPVMYLAWKHIQPDLVLLIDEELWPEFLTQASRREVPVFLINARLSDRSYRYYRRVSCWVRWLGKHITWVALPSEEEAVKFKDIGMPSHYLSVVGNLKWDREPILSSLEERLRLREELGFSSKDIILIGMSTWPGEESLLLDFLKKVKHAEISLSVRLLLAPRHAERRGEVSALLRRSGFSWYRRSEGKVMSEVDVVLADTTGELERLAFVGDIAFIGKSFGKNRGGQNPLDAAFAGLPMIYGPHMSNFQTIAHTLELENVAWVVRNEDELYEQLLNLLGNASLRKDIASHLQGWVRQQMGATEKIYRRIQMTILAEKLES
jgi:3-deoxy-D-manno-octulosonic-acid transferase